MANPLLAEPAYRVFVESVKDRIHAAQIKAAFAVNSALIELYWEMGKLIAEKQQEYAWGDKIIEQLAHDLKMEMPGISGFSRRNLFNIQRFYRFYKPMELVQQLVALIPWGHHVLILSKIKAPEAALFYLQQAGEFKPEFAGKMNFYLSAVDDLLKTDADHPAIGIILCKSKNRIEVEYALRDINKPMGVSAFRLADALPADLKSDIPTVAEFEAELNKPES